MSKYIDADRIREEIERQITFLPTVGYSTQVASEFIPVQNVLNYILSFIDSLQQEQPKMNIPSAGSGAMGTTPPKFKLDVMRDLPADLEKEIQEYLEKLGGGHGGFVDDLIDDDLIGLALHFYEFGRARKEE